MSMIDTSWRAFRMEGEEGWRGNNNKRKPVKRWAKRWMLVRKRVKEAQVPTSGSCKGRDNRIVWG